MEEVESAEGEGDDVAILPGEPRPSPCSFLCDPTKRVHRFIVLCFMCFLNFGSYYCFDNPAALEDKFTSSDGMGLSATNYGLLYTVYAWPNVIFPLIGGFLIDGFLGLRIGAITFAGFIMMGQLVFAGGGLANSFWLMLVGRVLFSVGGENLAVCQNNYAVKWFKGKELNTVFGIQLSFARVGSTVNMYAMGPIYAGVQRMWPTKPAYTVLGLSLLIGAVSTMVSFGCAFLLSFFDRRRDIALQEVVEEEEKEEEAPASVRDLFRLPPSLWIISLICVAYYNAVFPLIGFGLLFYESKFELGAVEADSVNSLVYLISIGASPLSGMLVDYFGANVVWVGVATLVTLFAHILLAFTFLTPFLAVVILGMGYSLLAASLWSMVAYIVPNRLLGTAYGAMQSIQNLGQGVIFIAAGAILDKGGYFMLELFFIFWLSLAFGFTVLLYFVDSALNDGVLSMSRKKQEEYRELKKAN